MEQEDEDENYLGIEPETLLEDYYPYNDGEVVEVFNIMDTENLDLEEAIEYKEEIHREKNSGISWIGVIVVIILIALAYNHFTSKKIENNYGYQVDTSGITDKPDCTSLEPQNPYDYDSGHYAGFEWGENGNTCGGNSDSFIEGCDEYQNQEDAYQYCLDRNND